MTRLRLSAAAASFALVTIAGCSSPERESDHVLSAEQAHEQLVAHTEEFEKTVYRVTDGVYQAVGFGLANSIMVEGDDCVFIVDSMAASEELVLEQDRPDALHRHQDVFGVAGRRQPDPSGARVVLDADLA